MWYAEPVWHVWLFSSVGSREHGCVISPRANNEPCLFVCLWTKHDRISPWLHTANIATIWHHRAAMSWGKALLYFSSPLAKTKPLLPFPPFWKKQQERHMIEVCAALCHAWTLLSEPLHTLKLAWCPKVHYMDKSATPLYLWIKVFCKFHCNKCITSSTDPCSLPLQKNVKECLVLKSSLNSSVAL